MVIKKYYYYFRLYFSNIFFYFTMKIGKVFSTLTLSKNYLGILGKTLDDLYKNGYILIPNYYDKEEIVNLNNLLKRMLDDSIKEKTDGDFLERIEGEIKMKHIQSRYPLLKRYSTEIFFTFLSFFFYGRPKLASVLCTITHDGTFSHPSVPGKCKNPIAYEPHVDTYHHYLKAMILLEDIKVENGPTVIMKGSSRNRKLFPNYVKLMHNENNTVIEKKLFEEIQIENPPKCLVGKKGDLILIDSRNVHWASNIKKGCRKIIWFYF